MVHRKSKKRSTNEGGPQKHRSRGKSLGGRNATRIGLVIAILLGIAIPLLIFAWLGQLSEPKVPKAAIVDQLNLTFPNPGFIEKATKILEEAGYSVDYHPGEEVTVEFYRNLPTQNYDLIILRVHSALFENGQIGGSHPTQAGVIIRVLGNPVVLFTSEPYNRTRYFEEQKRLRLLPVAYPTDRRTMYFGITPGFVRSSMQGDFGKATIIMMGCNGLTFTDTADNFLQKGARNIVSWDGSVSATHTDMATVQLLNYLLIEKLPLRKAVAKTMKNIGPDPTYGSRLVFYPFDE